jgi:dTDP-L-rhamnose 4-epimerase
VKVVVTGGGGFIGSHVVDLLVDAACDVVVVDVFLPGAHRSVPTYLNPAAAYEQIDVRNASALRGIVAGADAVLHQAAMVGLGKSFADVSMYVANNDQGTAGLLEALYSTSWRGRLLIASSMVIYGEGAYRCREHGEVRPGPRSEADLRSGRFDPLCPRCDRRVVPEPVTESTPPDPRNIYAATKLHQEHLCTTFGREEGVPVVALRYHNVYGPRMPRDTPYAGVASMFLSALQRGEPAEVFEDGLQLRDFVHVADVARANVCWLETEPAPVGAFNIGSGEPHSIGEMAQLLTEHVGTAPRPRISGHYRLGDVRHVFASTGRARRNLGWRAEVDFRRGMKGFAHSQQRR